MQQPEVLALLHQDGVRGPEGEPLVVDLLRNIGNGSVLTAKQLGEMLKLEGLTSYQALESEAVRYKQSEACRLRTDTGHTAFLKRIVLRELPSAAVKARWQGRSNTDNSTQEPALQASQGRTGKQEREHVPAKSTAGRVQCSVREQERREDTDSDRLQL